MTSQQASPRPRIPHQSSERPSAPLPAKADPLRLAVGRAVSCGSPTPARGRPTSLNLRKGRGFADNNLESTSGAAARGVIASTSMNLPDRGHLDTEARNERAAAFDALSIQDAFDVMSAEDASVAAAVARAKPQIVAAIRLVEAAFRRGGSLVYVGAGTSGRLGVLDASECPPTFLSDPKQVRGIIAGGDDALRRSIEGAEDDADAGAAAIDCEDICERDVVFGVSAGATTPFVHGALRRARERGASTVFLACVPEQQCPDDADVSIRVLTGPEVVTGSTRLKAGTATKLVLNRVTTIAMARTGKVFGNLMIDLNARANRKLTDRAARILAQLTGLARKDALALLERAEGRVKTALVMHGLNLPLADAEARLGAAGGHVRAALSANEPGDDPRDSRMAPSAD